MLRLALIFALVLVAFDAIAASVARAASFNYGQFVLLSCVIYVALGIYAGQRLRLARATFAIVVAALIDVSLGWYVAAAIGPARPSPNVGTTEIVGSAVLYALMYVILGVAGVVIGERVTGTSSKTRRH